MTSDPALDRTVADLLRRVTADPGRPRLTWYGPDGERIELSGAVLANWVAKTTNLLVEEFDAGPGVRVRLDLPPHWRTLVWALAVWRAGACVVVGGEGRADLVVSDRPEAHDADGLVAVALPALARRFDGPLPPGAIDAAAAVMTYGDVIGWAPPTVPAQDAVDAEGSRHPHADLPTWAAGAAGGAGGAGGAGPATTPPGARVFWPCGADRSGAVVELLRAALAVLWADGSLVVVAADVASELRAAPDRRARLLQSERVTGH